MNVTRITHGSAQPCTNCRQPTRTMVHTTQRGAPFCFKCSETAMALASVLPEEPRPPVVESPRSRALSRLSTLMLAVGATPGLPPYVRGPRFPR